MRKRHEKKEERCETGDREKWKGAMKVHIKLKAMWETQKGGVPEEGCKEEGVESGRTERGRV
jgi:hypothetical protein